MNRFAGLIIIFPVAITLHNIEEALWLPQWSQYAKKYHKQVGRNEFHFALVCVTLLAYLISFLFMFFDQIMVLRYIYFGYVGAMLINAIFPHLIATIVLRKYSPGVVTGILMNVPCFSLLIVFAIRSDVINIIEVIISTAIVGSIILSSLPILFRIGRSLTRFDKSEIE